jgi:ubiquinone/menaquinone biosynthesis C-methylase UbiE
MKHVNEDNREWFQEWANEYDTTLGKVKRHHKLLDLVVKVSGIQRNDQVLDIGCGTGLLSLKFLNTTECTITAIDSSSQMLKIFQEKIEKYNLTEKIHCTQESAEDMNFKPDQFDIIAATVSLHHVKFKEPVINNVYDYLKGGGRFVIGEIDMNTTGRLDDSPFFGWGSSRVKEKGRTVLEIGIFSKNIHASRSHNDSRMPGQARLGRGVGLGRTRHSWQP